MTGRRREEWRVPLGNWPSRPRHSCTIKYQTNLKKSCLTESIVCRYSPTFVMVRAFVERLTTLLGQIFLIERLLLLSLLFGRDISFPSSIIFPSALHFTFIWPNIYEAEYVKFYNAMSGCCCYYSSGQCISLLHLSRKKKLSCILSPLSLSLSLVLVF